MDVNRRMLFGCHFQVQLFWDAQRFLYLDCLYLEPDFRGMKIGDRVFEHLKEVAKANHCGNIQWQTPVFSEKAIGFYRRIGAFEKEKLRVFINL
ncbi:GNAT family N-acetyltransferase [Flavobacterium noncentrifugens]|uniref:GNAT family N-acetyltransferase n=1 Tax=Flavobacterium noncentrifugens TaxID=1128970 RepID=UPI001476C641|nr:GNAT family N-acetyltransferase [Flavobacterium noncentrifugens]